MGWGHKGALVAAGFGGRESSGRRTDADGIPGVRRSPSGRIPQWAIDEALGKLQEPEPWRSPPLTPAGRNRRQRRFRKGRSRTWRPKSALTVAVGVIVGLYLAGTLVSRLVVATALPHLAGAEAPPPGKEAAASPLGVAPASTGSTAYVLPDSPDPGQPFVAYDPCRPVHYVVRQDFAPPGTDQLIQESVAAVSAATGLQFVYDGPTDETPSADREAYQPDRYGKRWAPVLIAWSTPAEVPDLDGRIAGTGGSTSLQLQGEPYVYVTGQVTLDAPDLSGMLSYPNGPALVRAVIMHELAHVVGLQHIDDPTQLMYADNNGQLDFGAGDRAGLALLGTGSCVPRL